MCTVVFRLQPNKETQAKQIELWKQLLLQYTKAKRVNFRPLRPYSCVTLLAYPGKIGWCNAVHNYSAMTEHCSA